jgi:hypothetical protein
MTEPAASAPPCRATPACIQPRRRPVVEALPERRATARQLLDAALAGVQLGGRDRQFLSRLVHWDKRNAVAVASLIERARAAGQDEAALTPRQREIIIAALGDAAVHRASGAPATSCWDCEIVPGGRCADHSRDFDRASAYAELASALSSAAGPAAPVAAVPRDLSEYRQRAPVAS